MSAPLYDSRPCACGGQIDVAMPFGARPTSEAIGAALRDHYAGVTHAAWSARTRWAELLPRPAGEDVPSGRELRAGILR